MAGILFGVLTAFIWATTSLLIKAQASRIDTFAFNAFRLVVASIIFLALLPFFGGLDALAQLSASSRLALVTAMILGVAGGDSLYFWSLDKIGAARALPIANVYPVFTWVLAVPFLGESLSLSAMIGTAIALAGIYLVAPPSEKWAVDPRVNRLGVLAAVIAALLWAFGTMLMKVGLQDGVGMVVVNAFRLPVGAVLMTAFVWRWRGADAWRGYRGANLWVLIAISLYSTGLGAAVWVWSVEASGAARAALFNSLAPLIGVPLSIFFLRERVTWRIVLGAVLAVAGVWLVL